LWQIHRNTLTPASKSAPLSHLCTQLHSHLNIARPPPNIPFPSTATNTVPYTGNLVIKDYLLFLELLCRHLPKVKQPVWTDLNAGVDDHLAVDNNVTGGEEAHQALQLKIHPVCSNRHAQVRVQPITILSDKEK
jgi:hypothetical protein